MSDIKQAQAMLRMAHRDLNALRGMQNAEVFADEIFGFHVQQAVEKSLKAWMCTVGITYPFTHQISRLLVLRLMRFGGWTSSRSTRTRRVMKRGMWQQMRRLNAKI